MTPGTTRSTPTAWDRRRKRAEELLPQCPHSAELLGFYLSLLDLQEALYLRACTGGPLHSQGAGEMSLAPAFRAFIQDVVEFGTELIQEVGQSLLAQGEEGLDRLLGVFLTGAPLEPFAPELGCDAGQIAFYPRAFLQPFAEAGAEAGGGAERTREGRSARRGNGEETGESGAVCPFCGRLPQVAFIQDQADVKGLSRLVCSFCASEWDFPRSTCPGCLESGPEVVLLHSADTMDHVRIMECTCCRAYLKSVDLRSCGVAVPLVEDLATVELDLWSSERGLRKIQTNVLGY